MANGCTCFPDKIFKYNLKNACDNHDANYWFQTINRKESDIELREDVNTILPTYLRFIGWGMYFGIRLLGWFNWNKYNGGKHGKENKL